MVTVDRNLIFGSKIGSEMTGLLVIPRRRGRPGAKQFDLMKSLLYL